MSVSVDAEGRRVRLDLSETEATELLHLLRRPNDFLASITFGADSVTWRDDADTLPLHEVADRLGEAVVAAVVRGPASDFAQGRKDAALLERIEAEIADALHAEGLAGPGTGRRDRRVAAVRVVSRCPSLVALALPGPRS